MTATCFATATALSKTFTRIRDCMEATTDLLHSCIMFASVTLCLHSQDSVSAGLFAIKVSNIDTTLLR